jgi:hypothetical protein
VAAGVAIPTTARSAQEAEAGRGLRR